jgi:hypothetical protein
MKELFIYVLIALACAYGTVWLILQGDAAWSVSSRWFFPSMIAFIHGHGYSVKEILLISIFTFYLVTTLHRYIARGIFVLIIWTVVIMLVIAAAYALWQLLLIAADHL